MFALSWQNPELFHVVISVKMLQVLLLLVFVQVVDYSVAYSLHSVTH